MNHPRDIPSTHGTCPRCGTRVKLRKRDRKIAVHPLYLGAPNRCPGSGRDAKDLVR